MVADVVDDGQVALAGALRRPRPNCCSQTILDSVGRSIMTVSIAGTSTPSLNMSTAKSTSSSPACSASRDIAAGHWMRRCGPRRAESLLGGELGHEVGMALRHAERQRALAPRCAAARSRAVLGLLVTAAVSGPRRIGWSAKGSARSPPGPARRSSGTGEQAAADPGGRIASKDQVLLTEASRSPPSVRSGVAVSPRRNRAEVVDQLPVGGSGCVVELVDDDVVEVLGAELFEMPCAAQGLDRGQHHGGVGVPSPRLQSPKLGQGRTRRNVCRAWVRISSRWATNSTRWNSGRWLSKAANQSSQASGQRHQPGPVPVVPGGLQRRQRLHLTGVGRPLRRGFRTFFGNVLHLGMPRCRGGGKRRHSVVCNPLVRKWRHSPEWLKSSSNAVC